MPVRVHVLDTGRVQVHRRQVDPHPRDRLRLPAVLLDRTWTPWLAVWTFAIEHPEGLVVVDAGQDPDWRPSPVDLYGRTAVRFDVGEADRVPARLREAGLDPSAVRHHVFTHLHLDHVGEGTLPGARAVVHEAEWRWATSPGARFRGAVRTGIADPETVRDGHDLHGDGRIVLLATPGHTPGHQSVLVTPDEGPRVLLTGDVVYSAEALHDRVVDGVAMDLGAARASLDRLRAQCAEAPTIVLPTHDTAARERLAASAVHE